LDSGSIKVKARYSKAVVIECSKGILRHRRVLIDIDVIVLYGYTHGLKPPESTLDTPRDNAHCLVRCGLNKPLSYFAS
jgi:hypothetical protein